MDLSKASLEELSHAVRQGHILLKEIPVYRRSLVVSLMETQLNTPKPVKKVKRVKRVNRPKGK